MMMRRENMSIRGVAASVMAAIQPARAENAWRPSRNVVARITIAPRAMGSRDAPSDTPATRYEAATTQ